MIRQVKLLLVALLVAFSAASVAEAAPKKSVRHRQKHSSRVSTGAAASGSQATATHKKTTKKKTSASANSTTKKSTTKKSTHRRPSTKPR